VIITVKLTQRLPHALSQTADAKAFELYDIKRQQNARAIAVVERPETPTPEGLDALLSITAVADEVIDPREGIAAVAERVEREVMLV
jgi:hypothetical protein